MFDNLTELFNQWQITGYLYGIFLVLCRVGAVIALLPGFGEQFVSMRVKLFAALGLSFTIYPLIIQTPFADMPKDSSLYVHIFSEIITGVTIGLWVRIIFMALTVAAGFCSQILGITNIFDASLEPGGAPALSGFFSFTTIAILMATGGHYIFFKAIIESYRLVPIVSVLNFDSLALSIIEAGAESFKLGLRIALPFLGVGFLVNLGLGFVNRAMPQIPVFFVGQPLIIAVGFLLLSLLAPAMIFNWSEAMRIFLAEHL